MSGPSGLDLWLIFSIVKPVYSDISQNADMFEFGRAVQYILPELPSRGPGALCMSLWSIIWSRLIVRVVHSIGVNDPSGKGLVSSYSSLLQLG